METNVIFTHAHSLLEKARELCSTACRFCQRAGQVLCHGPLRGYVDDSPGIRGHRLYCSRRGRHNGCGRTYSVMRGEVLPGRVMSAQVLQAVLDMLCAGASWLDAWRTHAGPCAASTAYRMRRRLGHAQTAIRAALAKGFPHSDPPQCTSHDPLVQTALHLRAALADHSSHSCPIAVFQTCFQQRFI